QERLTDAIVDLMGAGMVEILAFEPDLRAAQLARPALGMVDRAGASDKVLELVVERLNERRIDAAAVVRRTQLVERMHQRFSYEHAAIGAKMALGIRKIVRIHQVSP